MSLPYAALISTWFHIEGLVMQGVRIGRMSMEKVMLRNEGALGEIAKEGRYVCAPQSYDKTLGYRGCGV